MYKMLAQSFEGAGKMIFDRMNGDIHTGCYFFIGEPVKATKPEYLLLLPWQYLERFFDGLLQISADYRFFSLVVMIVCQPVQFLPGGS